jgi:hypothetical protein
MVELSEPVAAIAEQPAADAEGYDVALARRPDGAQERR